MKQQQQAMKQEHQAEMKTMKQEHQNEIAALKQELLDAIKVSTQEQADAKEDTSQQLQFKGLQAGACVTSLRIRKNLKHATGSMILLFK